MFCLSAGKCLHCSLGQEVAQCVSFLCTARVSYIKLLHGRLFSARVAEQTSYQRGKLANRASYLAVK